MPRFASFILAVFLVASAAMQSARAGQVERIRVEGELIDTWCYVTEIMYARGSAHYQCAVWCAVGGIPVSIRAEDGTLYVVLRVEADTQNVSNPSMVKIQSHKVTVDGDLIRRDGVNYLLVTQVADDQGVVDLTHEKFGIQPWGM
jgi:myosin-crossreactive antigen